MTPDFQDSIASASRQLEQDTQTPAEHPSRKGRARPALEERFSGIVGSALIFMVSVIVVVGGVTLFFGISVPAAIAACLAVGVGTLVMTALFSL